MHTLLPSVKDESYKVLKLDVSSIRIGEVGLFFIQIFNKNICPGFCQIKYGDQPSCLYQHDIKTRIWPKKETSNNPMNMKNKV